MAPFLSYVKLFRYFEAIGEFKNGATIRMHPISVKAAIFVPCVNLQFDGWPWKTIGHLFLAS